MLEHLIGSKHRKKILRYKEDELFSLITAKTFKLSLSETDLSQPNNSTFMSPHTLMKQEEEKESASAQMNLTNLQSEFKKCFGIKMVAIFIFIYFLKL